MKVSREQVSEHRARILAAASRLFRLRGFDEVTVADVMKDAGLTHGAFYGHFSSKEALIAEALGQALAPAAGDAETPKLVAAYARRISQPASPRRSRLLVSVFMSGNRGRARLRRSSARDDRVGPSPDRPLSAEAKGRTAHEKRHAAIAAWSAMVGAMVLARVVDDDKLSHEILAETRASLFGGGETSAARQWRPTGRF